MLLLGGLAVSWMFWCVGLTASLHKYTGHGSYTPKNRIIKLFLLWAGTVLTLGTAVDFAAGHRMHHKYSDTRKDPYDVTGTFWHKVKLFFYRFQTSKINPMIVKDLIKDKDHMFFNNHYWKILIIYPMILLLINPIYVGYFYALPVIYAILGMGYVTVIAHLPSLHKYGLTYRYDTGDNSWNSRLFAWLLAGEGYHNTHHMYPDLWNYETKPFDIDFSAMFIAVIKK
jgi:stearoyl-CoA desaturase (delta-9 desaturase)